MQLELLTPQEQVFSAEVDTVFLPLPDGWIQILPGHLGFCARVMAGQVIFRDGEGERRVATTGGTVLLADDIVTVLTGAARLDQDLETLRQEIGERIEEIAAAEQEAEKHFNRVYRQMARSFNRRH